MQVLVVHRLVERFKKYDGYFCPEDWEYKTTIQLFETTDDRKHYLQKLKKDFRGKGKVDSGNITGKRTTKESPDSKVKESITTEIKELSYGAELEVANEFDMGECPFGED